jgi:hypothetical protein
MMLVTSPVESLAGLLFLALGATLYVTRLKERTTGAATS